MITAIIGQDQESATTKSEWASDLIDQPRESVMLDINLTHRQILHCNAGAFVNRNFQLSPPSECLTSLARLGWTSKAIIC